MNRQVIRNIIYSVILLSLIIIIILIRTRTPFGRDNTSFTPSPGSEITKIELSSGEEKLLLEKTGETWTVNGRAEARKSAVSFIVEIVSGMKIKSPVSDEMFQKEIADKNSEPVKVRVSGAKRRLTTFYMYHTDSNIYGNIMKLTPAAKPYILYLPGFEGNVGVVFTLNELYWQPFNVFTILPSEISSITLQNLPDTSSSFSVVSERNGFYLTDTRNRLTGWDSSKVRRYVTYFTHVPFENWALELTGEDIKRIISKDPVYKIIVRTNDGQEVDLSLWQRLKEDNSIDTDRLWAKTADKDQLFVIRYFDIDPVLQKRSYFFGQ